MRKIAIFNNGEAYTLNSLKGIFPVKPCSMCRMMKILPGKISGVIVKCSVNEACSKYGNNNVIFDKILNNSLYINSLVKYGTRREKEGIK